MADDVVVVGVMAQWRLYVGRRLLSSTSEIRCTTYENARDTNGHC
jgi:hypothetical protein